MAENEEKNQFEFKALNEKNEVLDTIEELTGKVSIEYSNGDKFQGTLENGKRTGSGIYTFQNGNIYEGEFLNNEFNGQGKLTLQKGSYYNGNFINSKKEGEGLFIYKNKDRYSGYWKNDLREGEGIYIKNENNMKLKGIWYEGKFISGKWVLENGDFFEGNFKNNFPAGKGKWILTNGSIMEGEYQQRERNEGIEKVPKVLNEIYNQKNIPIESIWRPFVCFSLLLLKIFAKAAKDAEVTQKVKLTIQIGDKVMETPIIIGLFGNDTPLTAKNFFQICTEGVQHEGKNISFKNSIFHRVIPQFMIQGGDITNFNGTGGVSIYGRKFNDENFNIQHDVGVLSMANSGPNTNGSQFFITTAQTSWLDGKHVVFGRVTGSLDTLYAVENQGSQSGKPKVALKIIECEPLRE